MNYENDAALGISANEATRNAAAFELFGNKFKDLTEIQKQQTLLKLVEDGNALGGALGQAARETGGLENVLGNLRDAFTTLQAAIGEQFLDIAVSGIQALTRVINGLDITPFVEGFSRFREIVSNVLDVVIPIIQERLEQLRTLWQENGTSILETVTNAFNTIKGVIEQVINAVVPFVQQQLQVLTQFWNENGTQILTAVTNAFNAVKAVIDFVMPAILLVISVVWDAIKNVISGALNIILGLVKVFTGVFNGDFSKLWEGVKQLFSGAIDFILGIMTLTFFGGLRTLFTNLARTILNSVRTNWTAIVNTYRTFSGNVIGTIGNLVTGVVNFFRALATGAQSQIYSMVSNVLSRITTLANGMINAIRGLPARFTQFGRDIIQGLINGIKALGANAIAAVGDVANKIIDKVTGIFDINSPSRVMRSLGGFISEGLEVGIETKGKSLIDTTAKLGESIKDTFSNSLGGTLDANLTSSFNGAIPNPLRGNSLNLGMNNSSSAISSAATKANSNVNNSKSSVTIEPAPVMLDGKKIADVTFKQTSNNLYNATSVNGLMKGVKI